MIEILKPMLAVLWPGPDYQGSWPLLASVKLDGIRCIVDPGLPGDLCVYTRNGKPIHNIYIAEDLRKLAATFTGRYVFDGELVASSFRSTLHKVMSGNVKPEGIQYRIFDMIGRTDWRCHTSDSYDTRYQGALGAWRRYGASTWEGTYVKADLLAQKPVNDDAEVAKYLKDVKAYGEEGLVLRHPMGRYKHGRCTVAECNMYKLKFTATLDVRITGIEPLTIMMDGIDRTRDELGKLKRVHRLADRKITDRMGKLVVQDEQGRTFRVGTGFTNKMRDAFWRDRKSMIGRWCEVKSDAGGTNDYGLPRQPVFIRLRDDKV